MNLPHALDVSATLLITSVVSALYGHCKLVWWKRNVSLRVVMVMIQGRRNDRHSTNNCNPFKVSTTPSKQATPPNDKDCCVVSPQESATGCHLLLCQNASSQVVAMVHTPKGMESAYCGRVSRYLSHTEAYVGMYSSPSNRLGLPAEYP